jgi:hypothetical protein
MARSMYDLACGERHTGAMEVSCTECGHGLWTEEVPVADRFGVWACFDDEELSDTYAEHVGRCPGCGGWLHAEMLVGAHDEGRG